MVFMFRICVSYFHLVRGICGVVRFNDRRFEGEIVRGFRLLAIREVFSLRGQLCVRGIRGVLGRLIISLSSRRYLRRLVINVRDRYK